MKALLYILVAGLTIITSGCGKKAQGNEDSPAFMFWCYRKEVVSADFHVPDMDTPAIATYIQNKLRAVPGYENSRCDLENRTLTVSYKSSTIRKMNIEEAIAMSGYSVNGRPAYPNPEARSMKGTN